MAVVYHEIYLPIDTESTFDYIVIKQGDAGTHKVRATLISNNRVYTIPTSGVSYFMKFRKPDNNYCLVEATVSDNTISAEVTEEMLRVSGTGRGEFMIVSGSDELKTATFHVKIVRQTFTSGDVQSHSDFAPFAALLQGAGAAASNANTAAAAANAAARLAEQKAQAIPDDYSDLVADVAGKADKSTTYTKTQVDQMIADVEVETDTTLAVSGAPADSAETGRQIGLLKADLGDLIAPPRLNDNTDLDSVITSGVYMLYANSAYLNKPTQDAEHGILEVWRENYGDNAGRFFQRLTYTYKAGRTNSEIWVRSKSAVAGAAWTPWISVSNMSINDVENLLQEKTGLITKIEGSYINLTTDPVSLTPVANALWAHSVVNCSEGDVFVVNADGGQSPRAWGFLDSSNHILSVADASTIVKGLKLTAPANATKLIINDRSGAVSYIVGSNLASSKIDVQQSPGDAGKVLVIGNDGRVIPGTSSSGSGLTDDIREALLICFRSLYWKSENSDFYYKALQSALYASESSLSATLVYGNSYVFADDPLAKIKFMMSVYYEGTEVPITQVSVRGELTTGKNIFIISSNGETTTILFNAEEKPASRLTFTGGDLYKFDGKVYEDANKVRYNQLNLDATCRIYYAEKGHCPYNDINGNAVAGKYPIPIPADATHVRVAVAPNSYKVSLNCWRYNNSTKNYGFMSTTRTEFTEHISEVDIPETVGNARALTVQIRKPDGSAFDASTEPTQVVVQFT